MPTRSLTKTNNTLELQLDHYRCSLDDTPSNQKVFTILSRTFKDVDTGKPVFTFQEISQGVGHQDRQYSNNLYRDFQARNNDFQQYLSRKNTLKDSSFLLIESQILESPFLPLNEHYTLFTRHHPALSLSRTTFEKYVSEIESNKLLKRYQALSAERNVSIDVPAYLKDILELATVTPGKHKEIVSIFPEVEETPAVEPLDFDADRCQFKLFLAFLYACGLAQHIMALLFGVSQTTVHNSMYDVCGEGLEVGILDAITHWSGQVSFDEKWIKINGVWHFMLSAVDAVSGFPLLMGVYTSLDDMSWRVFFLKFKAIYGVPRMILSDGSVSLLAAKANVFAHVRHQLCKFHTLKNLIKKIRTHVSDSTLRRRAYRLAKHIFSNRYLSSRKFAAKTLQHIAGEKVSRYIEQRILGQWRKLTQSQTNNVAERWNRTLEKGFVVRYGIPTLQSANVLMSALWFKELLLHGRKHGEKTNSIHSMSLPKICQEKLEIGNILHFFKDNGGSCLEKLG